MSTKEHGKEMGFEGAGPKIMLPMFIMAAITGAVSYVYRPLLNYPLISSLTLSLGVLFLVIGVPFWVLAVKTFFGAFKLGYLATRGPFAIMPNPIYGSFMVLVIPGISLVLNLWPILLTSVLGYLAIVYSFTRRSMLYKRSSAPSMRNIGRRC